ncbi:TIGR02281 family clan AA aspartic protease [Litorimonas sp. RW-G-Af-16]|uniref:TIGR02281 family clan AA aspartic protease n=1 Tax=Litorimonas sp. RW-G-Af-16 TaxID=3241168 RepID=UPI003AAF8697
MTANIGRRSRVNSGHVKFLVDTGASSVALTYEDARKAGIKVRDLRYNVPISTAGGTNYAAYVKLDSVSLGAITIRDVDALVVKDGLTVSLLGMTYLGQLQKVEATPNALLLRL